MTRLTPRVSPIHARWLATALVSSALLLPAAHADLIVSQLDSIRTGTWNFRDDNSSASTTSPWKNANANYYQDLGTYFAFDGDAATATSTVNLPTAGIWSVEMWMPSRVAAPDALLTVVQGSQSTSYRLNQNDANARWAGGWMSLGTYALTAGSASVILDNSGATGGGDGVAAMTSAVRFAQISDGVTPFVLDSNLGPVGSSSEFFTEVNGAWSTSTSASPLWGSNRISNTANAEAEYSGFPLAQALYELELTWTSASNRTDSALLTVVDANGVEHETTFSQKVGPDGATEAGWQSFGTFLLDSTSIINLSSTDTSYLTVDAMRVSLIPEPASLALMGLGSLLMLGRSRRA